VPASTRAVRAQEGRPTLSSISRPASRLRRRPYVGALRSTPPAAGRGLRAQVAANIRERFTDIWRRSGGEGEPPSSWLARATGLDAGEPVRVAAWELPHAHPAFLSCTRWYLLEPDGTLDREVER
jgi:hypothetical protein